MNLEDLDGMTSSVVSSLRREHITTLESLVMLILDELRELQNPESHKDIQGGTSSHEGWIRICLRLQ